MIPDQPPEPKWLTRARADIGLRELPGPATEPRIAAWLKQLRAWWKGDDVPWCGTAVAAWMTDCGIRPAAAWYRAKGWLDWGVPIDVPIVGCVVVFERQGGGHVGLCVGVDMLGRLQVLGGNQGDAVNIRAFPRERVLGYRWPATELLPKIEPLPLLTAADVSRGEA